MQRRFGHDALEVVHHLLFEMIGAQELLSRGGVPSRDAIREHISGNYCRCTGYQAIVDAVEATARARMERTS